jgi:hypothetical protein
VDPDSLLKLGAATGWLGWATVGGDTTSITIDQPGLQPGTRWMAAIVAVDEAGAATPYVSFDANLLAFDVVPNGGPSVHVFASFIDYTSPPSSLAFSPGVEVPAGRPLTFKMEGIRVRGPPHHRHALGAGQRQHRRRHTAERRGHGPRALEPAPVRRDLGDVPDRHAGRAPARHRHVR